MYTGDENKFEYEGKIFSAKPGLGPYSGNHRSDCSKCFFLRTDCSYLKGTIIPHCRSYKRKDKREVYFVEEMEKLINPTYLNTKEKNITSFLSIL